MGYKLLLLCAIIFWPVYGADVVGVKKLSSSYQEFEAKIGALPASINDLDSFQRYAAHYAYASHELLKDTTPHTEKDPCVRIGLADEKSVTTRFKEVFDKAIVNFHLNSIFLTNNVHMYFYVNNKKLSDRDYDLVLKNFLMSNNQDLLPNYEAIFSELKKSVDEYKSQADFFAEKIAHFSDDDISKMFKIKFFLKEEKTSLLEKIRGINADINRIYNVFNMIGDSPKMLQVLDVYLLAEQSINYMQATETVIKMIVESGYMLPDSKPIYVEKTNVTSRGFQMTNLVLKEVPPRKDIGQFFKHRQFPLRSLYLMSRATAFSLRDFVDQVRETAGLPPLPEKVFEQNEHVKKALTIDETLPNIEEFIAPNKRLEKSKSLSATAEEQTNRSEWLEDTCVTSFKKSQTSLKKAPKKKKLKSKPVRNHTLKKTTSSSSSVADTRAQEKDDGSDEGLNTQATSSSSSTSSVQLVDEENLLEKPKRSIGERVHRLLGDDEKTMLAKLFSLQENSLSHQQVNALNMSIYKALIDLNKAYRAADFLKKACDSRIFTKGKDEHLLSKTSMEHRLLPYLLQDMVHPDFDKEVILKDSAFLRERVLMEKIMLHGDEIDLNMLHNIEDLLRAGEQTARLAAAAEKRILLVNLAHAWHKLAIALERARGISHKAMTLEQHQQKILSLLNEALPIIKAKDARQVTILEAYLYSYYLKIELDPEYDHLSASQADAIQKRAAKNLQDPSKKWAKTIHKVTPSGKKIGEYSLGSSLYHAITNDELGDYIIISSDRPLKERKIPLFVHYNDVLYRTDVFGGSFLKPDPGKGDYGSLIAVPLRAGDFFKRWFTSMESFWYGQRAFMPANPDEPTKSASGKLRVATIPDHYQFVVMDDLIVQDGFGYIKASVADSLGLKVVNGERKPYIKNMPYQMLQSYDAKMHKDAASELVNNAIKTLSSENFAKWDQKERANVLMGTLPKVSALGVPVRGQDTVLSDTAFFRDFASEGIMVDKSPITNKKTQVVRADGIKYSKQLNDLPVFQYTMTGYIQSQQQLIGSFFKGLLGVIPDEKWPKKYADVDMLTSSKDQKLNQTWLTEKAKNYDQTREQRLDFVGMVVVKQERNNKPLVGVPVSMAEKLAGDYDGDIYDLIPRKNFQHASAMIEEAVLHALPNAKIKKNFEARAGIGNFAKIFDVKKPVSGAWNTILNRFGHLPQEKRAEFADIMVKNHRFAEWLGDNWQEKLSPKDLTTLDMVLAEVNLGAKFGEDIYKTKVDANSLMARAQEYEKELNAIHPQSGIPSRKALLKKLEQKQDLKAAAQPLLEGDNSANFAHWVARGVGRYIAQDTTYEDYLSDDEEEHDAQDE